MITKLNLIIYKFRRDLSDTIIEQIIIHSDFSIKFILNDLILNLSGNVHNYIYILRIVRISEKLREKFSSSQKF